MVWCVWCGVMWCGLGLCSVVLDRIEYCRLRGEVECVCGDVCDC